jgi:hypothetical protein
VNPQHHLPRHLGDVADLLPFHRSFHNAVRIYPKKADVIRHNHAHMVGLNSPAIYVPAVNEGIGAEKAESSDAGNL